MLRRTFLLGTAVLTVARSQDRGNGDSLGSLAYVDAEALWLRDLPDGAPHALATGQHLTTPRFSPSGQWVSFRDGDRLRVVSTTGRTGTEWRAESGAWIAGDDEIGQAAIDKGHNQVATSSRIDDGRYSDGVEKFKTTLLLGPVGKRGETKRLAETEGLIKIAGFTRSGDWLVYWMSPGMSASIRADGLGLYAVSTGGGEPRKLGLAALVYPDMISISPASDILAVTSGLGRETWARKAIALVDLTGNAPVVRSLTEGSASAQLPSWSPDGEKLAWCQGPDADALYRQQLLASGQKTIKVIDPGTGTPKEIPIPKQNNLGAPYDLAIQCVRLRRILVAGNRGLGNSMQLTNDSRYYDEEPMWSRDGSHILFGRVDPEHSRTIWIMRDDGSEARQVAGPLAPLPTLSYYGYYGYTDWGRLFDWWRG